MNHIEQALKDAVEKGGWINHPLTLLKLVTSKVAWWSEGGKDDQGQWLTEIFLDPLFWQAFGKASGWGRWLGTGYYDRDEIEIEEPAWKVQWHRLIDHLAEGKDAESFFATLV